MCVKWYGFAHVPCIKVSGYMKWILCPMSFRCRRIVLYKRSDALILLGGKYQHVPRHDASSIQVNSYFSKFHLADGVYLTLVGIYGDYMCEVDI